jgi:hypothetical protein
MFLCPPVTLSLPQCHNVLPPNIFSDTLNVLVIGPKFIYNNHKTSVSTSLNFDDQKTTVYYNLTFFRVIRRYFSEQGDWANIWIRVRGS